MSRGLGDVYKRQVLTVIVGFLSFGRVEQLVARMAHTHEVVGSNPISAIRSICYIVHLNLIVNFIVIIYILMYECLINMSGHNQKDSS